ncbi:hypothetical protein [Devosia sp. DBB001]|nr:hypothetical protein [Devosia sp. DBB001]
MSTTAKQRRRVESAEWFAKLFPASKSARGYVTRAKEINRNIEKRKRAQFRSHS